MSNRLVACRAIRVDSEFGSSPSCKPQTPALCSRRSIKRPPARTPMHPDHSCSSACSSHRFAATDRDSYRLLKPSLRRTLGFSYSLSESSQWSNIGSDSQFSILRLRGESIEDSGVAINQSLPPSPAARTLAAGRTSSGFPANRCGRRRH